MSWNLHFFKDVLLDFTVQYLIEQPDELVEFALAYFSRLQVKRRSEALTNNESEDESMLSEEEFNSPHSTKHL